ncbi:hypothetical protein JB92DRAFT_2858004 [Gautieria morchelliformis]|nr:hypothetical protein JB92DRAFT_2858004 [Gautieria morchelliformis]
MQISRWLFSDTPVHPMQNLMGRQIRLLLTFSSTKTSILEARETMYRLPTASTANAKHAKGKARASGQGPSFKLPSLPGETHGEDIFGISSSSICSRTLDSDDLEISNKTIVRKSAVEALAARGMSKEHLEFKELCGWVIHGVGFSLR